MRVRDFFAGIGATRFRRVPLVVIQTGAAQLGPQGFCRGCRSYAILAQQVLEGMEGGGGAEACGLLAAGAQLSFPSRHTHHTPRSGPPQL